MNSMTVTMAQHAALEPPYGIIWNRWKRGKVVPFLGAGASMVHGPDGTTWDAKNPTFLPSGVDLSRWLAKESNFPGKDEWERSDLAKVSSYYEEVSDREELRGRLREVLRRAYQPGPLHEFLALVPVAQVIVVTNYDTLLEQAFQAAGKRYDLVVYPADRTDIANSVLWWPHGQRDGNTLASGSRDGTILIWDNAGKSLTGSPLRQDSWVRSLAFSPDGRTLASGGCAKPHINPRLRMEACNAGEILEWDLGSRGQVGEPIAAHTGPIYNLAFQDAATLLSSSTDGLMVSALGKNSTLAFQAGDAVKTARLFTLSASGKTLASGSNEGKIILADRGIGAVILELPAARRLKGFALSADGQELVSLGLQGDFDVWDLSADSRMDRVCTLANRNLADEERKQYLIGETLHPCILSGMQNPHGQKSVERK